VNNPEPVFMWRQFIIPPQDGSNPNWDMQSIANMTHAYIFNGTGAVDLKALSPSVLNQTVYKDWGTFAFNGTHSFAGTNTAWGGTWAVDQNAGIAYIATSQPSPDWNGTFRPGPNLWSDSIISINDTTGKFNWAFQTSAHDLWDYDCSWSVMLGNTTINGAQHETVFKGCKNGYFYALDAQTGGLLWYFDAPSLARTPSAQLHNPLNQTQMDWNTECGDTCTSALQNPTATGGIESDPAYDPNASMVFVATYNSPMNATFTDVAPTPGIPWGGPGLGAGTGTFAKNTTVWALDANSGKPIWSYDIPTVGFRGGIAVSGGVVFIPSIDGNLYMVNEHTGTLISKLLVGEMNVEPAIAQDTAGNFKIIIPSSSAGTVGGTPIPGNVFALTVPKSAVSTPTTTSSTGSTQSTQASGGSTATTTVVLTSISTSISNGGGVSSTAFYGVVAVAIILLIAVAVLAMRRRPMAPASSSTTTTTTST